MSNMSLDDIKDTIKVSWSESTFLEYFEISIEDLVERFTDLIEEQQEALPLDLNMETFVDAYEDRGCE